MGTDPLDPASLLIFGVGPLCGTPVSASRTEVTFKSPETGFLGSANFGGFFDPEVKYAGYDNIVIPGKADKPVYLWIYNDQVEIRDASHLWGRDSYETQDIIRSEGDPETRIACIGQAGENLVRFATLQSELGHGAGRTGAGCVMGSKNLKAIAVRETSGIAIADPERYLSIAEELHQVLLKKAPLAKERHEQDTAKDAEKSGFGITYLDWKQTVHQPDILSKFKPKKAGCLGCPIQCMELFPVEAEGSGVFSCTFYVSVVRQVKNDDLDLMLECSLRAQRYGVDIVSSMGILGWLMELHEKGLITAKDTDG